MPSSGDCKSCLNISTRSARSQSQILLRLHCRFINAKCNRTIIALLNAHKWPIAIGAVKPGRTRRRAYTTIAATLESPVLSINSQPVLDAHSLGTIVHVIASGAFAVDTHLCLTGCRTPDLIVAIPIPVPVVIGTNPTRPSPLENVSLDLRICYASVLLNTIVLTLAHFHALSIWCCTCACILGTDCCIHKLDH